MFLKRAISRLRAAHGLAFAMAAGQKPDQADLEAAGLGGVATDRFGAHAEGKEPLRTETPEAASTPVPSGVTVSWNGSPAREAA